ncbi:lytic transglycosylase domain-containing protein [uncultured Roseibium sp.]|uniref:lytic transglycosylase domain-containing protein n=1 Tax=uncultured Roseibium sp. TaxID=1936171 RepID=UPI002618EBBD|nr:lytic transglycosylase domain-containing protein [uncultured Roseibium sp.]
MPIPHTDRRGSRAVEHPHGVRRIGLLLLSGLLLGLASGAPVLAEDETQAAQSEPYPYATHVAEAARRFAIPERWIRTVMGVESAGDSRAVSSAGAMGLMQVMPDTWDELRLRHGLGVDPFAPCDNILAGTAYLREMLDRYGNAGAMLAAYNAGPERYDEYFADGHPLPAETRAYVANLAPLLAGATLPQNDGRPADWREAGLFVGASDPVAPQNGCASVATPAASPASSDELEPAPATEMFVARSCVGGAP